MCKYFSYGKNTKRAKEPNSLIKNIYIYTLQQVRKKILDEAALPATVSALYLRTLQYEKNKINNYRGDGQLPKQ